MPTYPAITALDQARQCEALRDYRQAAHFYREATRQAPADFEGHYGLGSALIMLGQFADAVAALDEALCLRPDHAEAHNNRAVALAEQGRLDEAAAGYHEALRASPDYAFACYNLGNALKALGRFDEAAVAYGDAVRLSPDWPEAHVGLGLAHAGEGRLDEAAACYERALRLRPGHAEAHNNLGLALQRQGRRAEAMRHFDEAVRLQPDLASARSNRAQLLMLLGDFRRGWPEYEWRLRLPGVAPPPLPQPAWDGAPLAGRTLLLRAEQGIGDTLQFVRYAGLARRMGGRVLLECAASLHPLLAGCEGLDGLVARGGELPSFDVQAALLSVPGLLGVSVATVPCAVPYLRADAALVERWRQMLGERDGFRVGIAWQGSRGYPEDRYRSMPLRHFRALAEVPGVRLYSLQKGDGAGQVSEVDFPVTDLGPQLDEGGAFTDTAAVMHNLDLVVTADTAAAHLAGAMGVPAWVALPLAPDWRWLVEREDTPWYPSVRLFRQTRLGDWDDVFARIAAEVGGLRSRPPAAPPITAETSAGELIDKITILEIKRQRLADEAKRRNVAAELAVLTAARDAALRPSGELAALAAELKEVNERLWEAEDELRLCEEAQDFGERFVALARSVYQQNDRRAALKRRVNGLLGSRLVEEKSYGGR